MRNVQNRKNHRSFTILATAILGSIGSSAFAADGTWINLTPNFSTAGATNGEWGNPANWSGGIVANGVGAVANLNLDWTGTNRPRFSITNGSNVAATYTIGTLNLTDTNPASGTYAEVGGTGTLLLDNGVNKPVINTAGISLFWNGSAKLAGTNGFRKTANSDDDIRGNNSGLSGTVVIEAGRVRMFGGTGGRNALGVGDLDMRSGTSIYFAVGGGALDYSARNFILSGDGTAADSGVLRIGNGAVMTINNLTLNGTGTPANRTTLNFDTNGNSLVVNGAFGGTGDFRLGSRGGSVTANNGATYTGATVLENGFLITRGNLATSSISITGTGDAASVIGWETGTTITLGGVGTTVTNTGAGTGAVRASGPGTTVVVPGSLQTSYYVHNGGTIDAGAATIDLQPNARLMGLGTIKAGTVNIYEDTPVMIGFDRVTSTNTLGTLTIQGNANISNSFGGVGAGIGFDLSGSASGVNDKLVVTGSTTLASPAGAIPVVIAAASGFLDDADYTLIDSGTLSGTATYAVTLPSVVANQRTTYAVSDTAVANKVVLKATGAAASLTWNGPGGSKVWDIKNSANFLNAGAPDQFFIADAVTFGDSAATKDVQLTVNGITPSAMNLTNTAAGGAYTFTNVGTPSGANVTLVGNLTGNFPINKTGDGDVNWNFNVSGNYVGDINIDAGNFIVNSTQVYATTTPAALGVGLGGARINIGPNGTLINRNTVGASMGNTVTGSGTLRLQTPGDFQLNTADNSGFSGAMFIENGRVFASLPVSFGTGPITVKAPASQTTSPTAYITLGTVGATTINNPFTIAGGGRFGGDGALRFGGTQAATLTNTVTLAADATITVDTVGVSPTIAAVTGPGGLNKRGDGNVTLNSATYAGATTVEAGSTIYNGNATLGGPMTIGLPVGSPTPAVAGGSSVVVASSTSAASPKLLAVTNLTINAPTVATAAANTLDLKNNALNINYTGTSPLAAVKALINAGRDGAQPGEAAIVSTDATPNRAIGYAEASAVVASSVFGAVDGTNLLVRHTVVGDSDLNGLVNFNDLLALAQNYNGTGKEWYQGDFTGFDGAVDFNDLLALAQNYNGSLTLNDEFSATFAADFALAVSLTPEPASLLALAGLGGTLLRRRR
jgi:autotransporter-associated beta strand protein